MPVTTENGTQQIIADNNEVPRVAVLLAAYNGIQFIAEQVTSICAQVGVNVSIYISIDSSSDGTYEWCKNLEKNSKNIYVLGYGKRFGGAARNFFQLIHDVDISDYDYVALSDQDDIWMPNKLSHAIERLHATGIDAYSSDVIAFWKNGKMVYVKKSYPQKEYDYYFEAAGPGCSYVFNVPSFMEFKTFLRDNWESVNNVALHDWLIYAFYRSRGLVWLIDDTPLLLYRQHESNQHGLNFGYKAIVKRIKLVKQKWYRHEVEKVISLATSGNESPVELDRLFILKNFLKLRRRKKDAFVLLALSLVGWF